jgi:hypothetical protein
MRRDATRALNLARAFGEDALGLFSFAAGLLGAGAQKKASRKAEAAQLQYLQKAIDEESRQYDTSRADFAPYRDIGAGALGPLGDIIGTNGDAAQGGAIDKLKASPLYQSLFNTGLETNLQNAAATGGLRGGDEKRSLADFGFDTLMKVILQQISNLGGLAGIGQSATGSTATLGAEKASQLADLFGNQGQVRAGGLLTRGGITAGMWNSAGGFADSLASAIAGGFGGGGGLSGGLKAAAGKLF